MLSLIEDNILALEALCERYSVKRLALFGSTLREDFDLEHSDLDFAVEFTSMSPQEHAESYFGLLDDLEALFGRRVELVETGAVSNPYRRSSIQEEQRTLYAAA